MQKKSHKKLKELLGNKYVSNDAEKELKEAIKELDYIHAHPELHPKYTWDNLWKELDEL